MFLRSKNYFCIFQKTYKIGAKRCFRVKLSKSACKRGKFTFGDTFFSPDDHFWK
ncbi:hypothetical protein M23134_05939 [Microscilla marina ATCC 23134]|uniref:Uncharacterized protein n=1 Tax=Microscilla marina ATCC 23134 TaxID=313606 RepID=A1ZZ56_MICM2|nr:hypothetical protein M23134_05939 [Microscilla marina ATCC 23134]